MDHCAVHLPQLGWEEYRFGQINNQLVKIFLLIRQHEALQLQYTQTSNKENAEGMKPRELENSSLSKGVYSDEGINCVDGSLKTAGS